MSSTRWLDRVALVVATFTLLALPAHSLAQDSLKVIFCGTSGPLPIVGRAKPCTAIQAGGSLFVVDIGPEATENLLLWRLPLATVKAVFISHLHSDHIGDLGELTMQSWVAGRSQSLPLVGPVGVDKLAAGFNLAYEDDHRFRKAHHEHDGTPFPLPAGVLNARTITTVKPDGTAVVWKDGDLTVTAIRVAHAPVAPAFGYRFDYKGRSVVISGDTRKWPALATASKGTDVFIHEAQSNEMTRMTSQGLKMLGNVRTSSIMADTVSYHTEPVEAADLARAAGARALVLTHLTQAGLPFYTPEAFTKGMDDGGQLDWRLAVDGMTIDLPVGSEAVRFGKYQ